MAIPNPQTGLNPGRGIAKESDSLFCATLSPQFIAWMAAHNLAIAFSTYPEGRLITIGPGRQGGVAVGDPGFGQVMILRATETGLYLTTKHQIWQLDQVSSSDLESSDCDRFYMPQRCEITGSIDINDLHIDHEGRLLVAITRYNCLAQLDGSGSFSPVWKPPFIDTIVYEDRCHLTGFCLESGAPAYVTVTGCSNTADGWRSMRADGGHIFDVRDDSVVADGLAMPHSPRLYRGRLFVLEAGSGWFGTIDKETGLFERLVWCPGVLRGLTFVGDYAVICLSKPRRDDIADLPLGRELDRHGQEAECAIYVLRLNDGRLCHAQVVHRLTITGSVAEIYEASVLLGTQQPMLFGLEGEQTGERIVLGADISGANALRNQPRTLR